MRIRFLFLIVMSAALGSAVCTRAATVSNVWDSSIAAGLTLTRGNSETLLTTLAFKSIRKTTNSEVLLGASGAYGETTTEKTIVTSGGQTIKKDETHASTANAAAYGQFNYLFTERFYGGGRVDYVHDAIADLKYRYTVSPLAGYYVLKTSAMKLGFEMGPSGVFERQGDEDNQYAALRLGERFEYRFTPKTRLWQSLDLIPQIDRFSNYLIVGELGAEAAFNDRFSLRTVLQDTYDNEPASERKNNDVKLVTSVVYKF
jgi:putative salt-induced outer membrane protein YdiY